MHELFEDGATVAARDSRGWSPLVWASFYGHDDVVAALLQHQADVDYRKAKDDAEAAARKQAATEALSSAAAGSMRRKKGDGGAAVSVPVNSPLHWAAFKVRRQSFAMQPSSRRVLCKCPDVLCACAACVLCVYVRVCRVA